MKRFPRIVALGLCMIAWIVWFAVPAGPALAKQPVEGGPSEGVNDAMGVQYRRATELRVNLSGPAAILALREELQLTDEQVERLQAALARQTGPPQKPPPAGREGKMKGKMKSGLKGETGTKTKAGMQSKMKQMMGGGGKSTSKSMAMPKSMMLRCRLVMGLKLAAADPAVALALRKPLELSDAQVERLEQIRDRARRQTRRVLKEDQAAKLEPVLGTPATFLDLYVKMLEDMQNMMAKMGQ